MDKYFNHFEAKLTKIQDMLIIIKKAFRDLKNITLDQK